MTDLVLEKNLAGEALLIMSILKERMVGVSEKIWDLMVSQGQAIVGEIGSQITHNDLFSKKTNNNILSLKLSHNRMF